MSAALRALLALGVLLCLAACGGGERRTIPRDVVADAGPPGVLVDGIYPGPPHDDTCCWAAREAHLRVLKDGPATDLAVQFWLPDLATFRRDPQALTVTVAGRPPLSRCCYGPGLHVLLVPLPAELRERTGPVAVTISARRVFVPARDGLGPDARPLAYVLMSARFRDLWSGRF